MTDADSEPGTIFIPLGPNPKQDVDLIVSSRIVTGDRSNITTLHVRYERFVWTGDPAKRFRPGWALDSRRIAP